MEGTSGKRERLIVLHASGVEGWVDGADLVFRSKMKSADYHDEMNKNDEIKEWLDKHNIIYDSTVIKKTPLDTIQDITNTLQRRSST